jgi:hypothetical protein
VGSHEFVDGSEFTELFGDVGEVGSVQLRGDRMAVEDLLERRLGIGLSCRCGVGHDGIPDGLCDQCKHDGVPVEGRHRIATHLHGVPHGGVPFDEPNEAVDERAP